MSKTNRLIGEAGRPYGHVPGHTFLDVEVYARKRDFALRIVWGSAQGRDEIHGEEEYARPTLDEVRDAALAESNDSVDDSERRKYIEAACARAASKERGRGAPRRSADGALRTSRPVRFTDGEWARVGELAEAAGLNRSDYIRSKLV